jgi:hypothetical protein
LGAEVGVLGPRGGLGGLGEVAPQPFRSLAGLAGSALASRLVVPWAHACPAGEVFSGWETAHVAARLSDDHLGRAARNPGDRAERLNRGSEKAELFLDREGELVDRLVEVIDDTC